MTKIAKNIFHIKSWLITATKTVLLCGLLTACSSKENTLFLGTTTTLEDSGFLEYVATAFYKETNIRIKPITVGSGELLTAMRRGDINIAITHDPEGEQQLLEEGIILTRAPIFYNHFLLVGPQNNPANINSEHSLLDAFQQILRTNTPFVSRADDSGTHRAEQKIWQQVIQESTPTNKIGYHQLIQTGTGMGASLAVAAQRQAYILVDNGTWLNFNNKQTLTIIWQDAQILKNPYHLLISQRAPQKTDTMDKGKNMAQAQSINAFTQWITSHKGKQVIRNYQLQDQSVFYTDPCCK